MAIWVIFPLALIIVPLSLSCYSWFKFYKLRNHFLVKARFPYITLIASVSMFISGCCGCIIVLLMYYTNLMQETREEFYSSDTIPLAYFILISITNVSAFTFCVLIVWRTLLLFDLWKMSHVTLDNKNDIILSMDHLYHTDNYATYKLCGVSFVFHNSTWILTVGTLFTLLFINVAICAPLSNYHGPLGLIPLYLFMFSWIAIVVIGIIIVFKARKVTEYMLCLRETYFIVIIVLLQILLNPVENMVEVHVSFVFDALLAMGGSFLVICIALWMVYKNEGKMEHPRLETEPSLSAIEHVQNKQNSKTQKLKKLYHYLSEGEQNYNEFADFLTKCFALENLLFFMKAVVFRQVVIGLIHGENTEAHDHKIDVVSEDNNNEETESENKGEKKFERIQRDIWCPGGMWKKIFSINFGHVNGLRESCTPKEDVLLHDIAQNIYHQYISVTAINEVNISAQSRQELEAFFSDDGDKEIQQYLKVFNGAIQEVYEMMDCVYRFKYKAVSKLKQ